MLKSQKSRDFELARNLNEEINCFGLTENAILSKREGKDNYKPRTLIDQTLELIDPTPNIYTLFVQFNARFFWNVLLPVEVKWSNRMTSCAGICTFHPRNRQCVIALSAPLLKLRPRKDLVETLLHEMIHGYLFLTNNNRDRDGHGPEFCKHMNRINKEAGTKITIYHSFHDEVKLYQQHWWRCSGPCQHRAPYFGTVRRAMNRAPGPSDFWWKEHQQTCGGEFIKIKEPEKQKTKNVKNTDKTKSVKKTNGTENNIFNWLTKSSVPVVTPKSTSTPKIIKPVQNNVLNGIKKLGNSTNNVHGWGTRGPNGLNNSSQISNSPASSTPKFSCIGTLGGSNSGQSKLLSKFGITSDDNHKLASDNNLANNKVDLKSNDTKYTNLNKKDNSLNNSDTRDVECPVCNNFIAAHDINVHIDSCLEKKTEKTLESPTFNQHTIERKTGTRINPNTGSCNKLPIPGHVTPTKKRKSLVDKSPSKQRKLDFSNDVKKASCPVCNKNFQLTDINAHLDKCLSDANETGKDSIIELNDSTCTTLETESIISISSNDSNTDLHSSIIESLETPCSSSGTLDNDAIGKKGHKCLVCDKLITPEMSLNDHLEDCIGTVFSDDSTMSTDCNIVDNLDNSVTQDSGYPCPVCMELIPGTRMNEHLDSCLKTS